ncbi:MAG: glycosyltransferase family 4 protein [Candidatus Uhrbacteria bacterium]
MRIIQANKFYFLKGGAERYMLDLSAWLESQGHEILPFAMQHPQNLPATTSQFFPSFVATENVRLNLAGAKTFLRMFFSSEARQKMSQLVDAKRPDIAHVHNIYTQLSPSILGALKSRRVPVVMTVHDHHLISPQYNVWAAGCGPVASVPSVGMSTGIIAGTLSRFHKNSYAASFAQVAAFKFHYNRGSYRNAVDIFLCPSDYIRRKMIAAGFPEAKLRTNHYGADPSSVAPSYGHKGYMLYVGRLSEEKGVETVIQIARQLPDVPFKIVGTGPEEDRLHALAHGSPNIEFVGFRSGELLAELYAGAMAVLAPSRVHEIFPLITLEAMVHGKPVIGSSVGGMPEVVEDRVTGLLVAPNDLHGWVEAVMRLAFDEDFRLGLARNARLAAETTFHVKNHHARVLKAYEDALAMRLASV